MSQFSPSQDNRGHVPLRPPLPTCPSRHFIFCSHGFDCIQHTLVGVFIVRSVPYVDVEHDIFRYFAERGTWDTTLETFVNVDGDPTQFAVRETIIFPCRIN